MRLLCGGGGLDCLGGGQTRSQNCKTHSTKFRCGVVVVCTFDALLSGTRTIGAGLKTPEFAPSLRPVRPRFLVTSP